MQPYPHYQFFPKTIPLPNHLATVIRVFEKAQDNISTPLLEKGKTSDMVLSILCPELKAIGFEVEEGKKRDQKIDRPVFFGEQGLPTLKYEIDAYHPEWKCGLEIEAGRAWMGNAIYRDLIQAMVMVQVDVLILAVPIAYKYKSSGKNTVSNDYANTASVLEALFSHTRIELPYSVLLIGY